MKGLKDQNLLDFLKHSRNYISATFFLKGISVLSIPIITFLLTPEDYGKVGVFTSFFNILVIIVGLNLFTSVVRYYHEESNNDINKLIWSSVLFTAPLFILYHFIFWMVDENSSFYRWIGLEKGFFLYMLFSSCVFFIVRLYMSYLQTSKKSRIYNIISVSKGFSVLGLSILFYYFLQDHKYFGRAYAEVSVSIFLLVFILITLARKFKFSFSRHHLIYGLAYSIPLIPHSLSTIILNSSDRILINSLLGSREAGLYTFAYQIGIIINIVITGTTKSWVPIFFQKMKETKYTDIHSLAVKYKRILFVFALFLIFFASDGIKLISNKEYHDGLIITPVVILGYCFMFIYTIYSYYSIYNKRNSQIAMITVVVAGLNVLLNYFMLPKFGYQFAAFNTLISFVTLAILQYQLALKHTDKNVIIPFRRLFSGLPIIAFGTGFVFVVDSYLIFHYSFLIKVLVFVLLIILLEYQWIKKIS